MKNSFEWLLVSIVVLAGFLGITGGLLFVPAVYFSFILLLVKLVTSLPLTWSAVCGPLLLSVSFLFVGGVGAVITKSLDKRG